VAATGSIRFPKIAPNTIPYRVVISAGKHGPVRVAGILPEYWKPLPVPVVRIDGFCTGAAFDEHVRAGRHVHREDQAVERRRPFAAVCRSLAEAFESVPLTDLEYVPRCIDIPTTLD
jgi:hypothetical protein